MMLLVMISNVSMASRTWLIEVAWQLLNDLDCEDVDGDDVHGDALEGDNVDGFKNQVNRSCLAVAQLTTFCAFCLMTRFAHK